MKAKEIRNMDGKGLDEKLVELKKELIKLNAQVAVGASIKNPGQVKKVKKTIARVLTIKQEKETQKPVEKKAGGPSKASVEHRSQSAKGLKEKKAEKKPKEDEKKQ